VVSGARDARADRCEDVGAGRAAASDRGADAVGHAVDEASDELAREDLHLRVADPR